MIQHLWVTLIRTFRMESRSVDSSQHFVQSSDLIAVGIRSSSSPFWVGRTTFRKWRMPSLAVSPVALLCHVLVVISSTERAHWYFGLTFHLIMSSGGTAWDVFSLKWMLYFRPYCWGRGSTTWGIGLWFLRCWHLLKILRFLSTEVPSWILLKFRCCFFFRLFTCVSTLLS